MTHKTTSRQNDSAIFSDDPFMQKILSAMAEDERNNMSDERTEQMLKKIKFAVMLDSAGKRTNRKTECKPIPDEKNNSVLNDYDNRR